MEIKKNHSLKLVFFRLGDVLEKCPGGANNGFDHNFVLANTEGELNFVCRSVRKSCSIPHFFTVNLQG